MKKYFLRLKHKTINKFTKRISKHDIKSFKIIYSHLINENSKSECDPTTGEYITQNKDTHYDLIITSDRILLVNTKDIIDFDVCVEVSNRAIKCVRKVISKDRQYKKNIIMGRKFDMLDNILNSVRK